MLLSYLKNARHKDIAYEFIDFMLDPNHAYQNASVVGYATPILESYQAIISHLNDEDDWLMLGRMLIKNITHFQTKMMIKNIKARHFLILIKCGLTKSI